MGRMRISMFLATILHLLVSVVPYTIEVTEDGEEHEGDGDAVLSPLKHVTSICAMKADSGSCKALNDRYHFNIKTQKCEIFNYGGCQGNENNFLTLEECQEKCIKPFEDLPEKRKRTRFKKEKPSYCLLENDPGICRGLITRYFYNKESQKCEKFMYGGCLGNQNNFWSVEECQDTCQETNPLVNSLQVNDDSILVTTTDNSTRVDQFVNSLQTEDGVLPFHAVENSTPTLQQVPFMPSADFLQAHDDNVNLSIMNNSAPVVKQGQDLLPSLCVMRVDRGICRAQEKRFFYNYTIGKCRPFSYSGCGGNENNFTTRKSCLQMCKKGKKGFIQKQGQKGIMKIRRKRKKRVKLIAGEIVIERI
ncbi:tissue factor pathway inhibitor isoform X3 [Anolis sagrei]|uniref:tissue factor pathway inhibitor isoform X3 n=1 Tax=Anolis sagrei TaxID=38937 RepID=UPI0035202363